MLHTLPAGFTQLEWFLGKGGGGAVLSATFC